MNFWNIVRYIYHYIEICGTLILASNISLPELNITNVISSGPMENTISWTLTLHGDQTVLKYYASYRASNEQTKNVSVLNKETSVTVEVKYNTNYVFEIQVETQVGKSKTASTKWLSVSGTPIYNVDIEYCAKVEGVYVGINFYCTTIYLLVLVRHAVLQGILVPQPILIAKRYIDK